MNAFKNKTAVVIGGPGGRGLATAKLPPTFDATFTKGAEMPADGGWSQP